MPALVHDTGQSAPRVPVDSGAIPTSVTDHARRAFGARLKAHREYRGISLSAIAATTKVKSSLLEGLENGDVSRWPAGMYRRAFFRDYVLAIGLPVERLTSEFSALFLNEGSDATKPGDVPHEPATPLRLTLAGSAFLYSVRRAKTAALDTAIVLLLSAAIALVNEVGIWTVAGGVALCYYAAATACFGRSPVSWWLLRQPRRPLVHAPAEAADLLLTSTQTPPSPSSPQAPVVH
jgi:transcriptional regulator with XRE-family HTH domain